MNPCRASALPAGERLPTEKSLRAFFEGGGFAAQVRQNFSGEMERVTRIGFGFA